MFPELAESQAKLIDSYGYALTRVTKMLGMLANTGALVQAIENKKKPSDESGDDAIASELSPEEPSPAEGGAPQVAEEGAAPAEQGVPGQEGMPSETPM